MRSEPERLISLLLKKPDGSAGEVLNGPGSIAWKSAGLQQRNGQCSISSSRLRGLMEKVPDEDKLPAINV